MVLSLEVIMAKKKSRGIKDNSAATPNEAAPPSPTPSVAAQLPAGYVFYAVAVPALIWLFHHDNIGRLLSGRERKIEFRH